MGTITAYAMSVAIILAIEYVVYKCLLANATFYRFNRGVLLACYAIALLAIPAGNLSGGLFTTHIDSQSSIIIEEMSMNSRVAEFMSRHPKYAEMNI